MAAFIYISPPLIGTPRLQNKSVLFYYRGLEVSFGKRRASRTLLPRICVRFRRVSYLENVLSTYSVINKGTTVANALTISRDLRGHVNHCMQCRCNRTNLMPMYLPHLSMCMGVPTREATQSTTSRQSCLEIRSIRSLLHEIMFNGTISHAVI